MAAASNSDNRGFNGRNGNNNVCPAAALDRPYTITVRHAKIQYLDVLGSLLSAKKPTTNVVLKDFNMTVQKGHIYGLLGASGCGKTSIIRAIVGQHDLIAGEIRVLGHKPKTPGSGIPGTTVGYMPQEVSLLDYLTIEEILHFYGQVAGMSTEEINDQSDHLSKLLELPEGNRIIGTLSGGQQRRVSFSVALLHSPPVLILDEPTVGIDPLLRESIWQYLGELVRTKDTTILITTHYINEATQVDIVGLMRDGKLMAEENPQTLIRTLNYKDLEEVIYNLCLIQSSNDQTSQEKGTILQFQVKDDYVSSLEVGLPYVNKKSTRIVRLRALFWKNMLTMIRYYSFSIFLVIMGFFTLACLCVSTGGNPANINIAVFNAETNCFSDGIVPENLYKNITVDCAMPASLSCMILGVLQDKEINVAPAESEEMAEYQVRKGKAWAAMMFKRNFTAALVERANYISPSDVDDEVINTGLIQIAMDSSNAVISLTVQNQIVLALKKVFSDLDNDCHTFKHTKDVPIRFERPVYGERDASYLDYTIPGVLAGCALMIPFEYTVSVLLPDRIKGSLERSLVAGVTMAEEILALFVACLGPIVVVVIILMVTPYVIFQRPMIGSYWDIFLVSGNLAIVGMLLGFLVAITCNDLYWAILAGSGIFIVCLFASGTLWPVQGAHPYVQWLFWCLPLTLPTTAVREIALKGWGLAEANALWSFACTTTWNIAFILLMAIVLRLQR